MDNGETGCDDRRWTSNCITSGGGVEMDDGVGTDLSLRPLLARELGHSRRGLSSSRRRSAEALIDSPS